MWSRYKKTNDNIWLGLFLSNNINPENFKGSVLYVGLGTCVLPKNQSDEVTKTTIIEIDKEIIDWNFDKGNIKDDWIIHHIDAKDFNTSDKFDVIVLDCWFSRTNKKEFNKFYRKYKKFLKPKGNIKYLKGICNN